jgi:hypothetical protein
MLACKGQALVQRDPGLGGLAAQQLHPAAGQPVVGPLVPVGRGVQTGTHGLQQGLRLVGPADTGQCDRQVGAGVGVVQAFLRRVDELQRTRQRRQRLVVLAALDVREAQVVQRQHEGPVITARVQVLDGPVQRRLGFVQPPSRPERRARAG